MFALRQTVGFCALVCALEQSGVDIIKDQFAIADVINHRVDKGKEWREPKQGKANRKHKKNASLIE